MLNERALASLEEKIKLAGLLEGIDPNDFIVFQSQFYRIFKDVFNTVLPQDLTYDEILALAEEQLQRVYDEFAGGN